MYRPPLRQQSVEIRQRMEHVRSRLPWSMDRARAETQRLTSWKFYVRRYPWVAAGVLAGMGYFLVPRASKRVIVESPRQSVPDGHRGGNGELGKRLLRALRKPGRGDRPDSSEVVAKSSLVGVVTSFLISSAVRMATAYAGNQARSYFASRMGVGAPPMAPPVPRAAPRKPSQPEQTHDR